MMISRNELIKEVAETIGATQTDTKIVFDGFEKVVINHIANQDLIKPFTGIMMEGVLVPEHEMYSHMLGKNVVVKARVAPKAKFGQSFKRAINK